MITNDIDCYSLGIPAIYISSLVKCQFSVLSMIFLWLDDLSLMLSFESSYYSLVQSIAGGLVCKYFFVYIHFRLYIFLLDWSFCHYACPFCFLITFFALKSTSSESLLLFWLMFPWYIFVSSFSLTYLWHLGWSAFLVNDIEWGFVFSSLLCQFLSFN